MDALNGRLMGAFSEPVNGAPVVATIELDDGTTTSLAFERRCWNEFIDAHGGGLDVGTPVVIEPEHPEGDFATSIALA